MKQFDPNSISNRFLKALSNKAGWTQIIDDSAVTSLADSIGEMEAEAIRYIEYLLKESKWKYARNLSSLLTSTPYLGYQPHRKISALNTDGFVISHDPQLQQAGIVNIFGISDLSTNLTTYSGVHMVIPKGTLFTSSSGVRFISTKDVSYDPGDKYKIIPILQGIPRAVSTTVVGNPLETIRINSDKVEAATGISSPFFSVTVTADGSNIPILYTQIEDIYLAGPYDNVYDVSVASDFSYIDIRFGNGIVGTQLTPNAAVTINFIESLGASGNVTQNYTITNIFSILSFPFYCTNFTSALGGQDEEEIDSIRARAPLAYLLNGGSIITSEAYKAAIEQISYIHLATVYSGVYSDPITGTSQGSITYSAIKMDGTAPDSVAFPNDVLSITSGKTDPLDYISYEPPTFLHLKFNIQGKTTSSNSNLSDIMSQIQGDIYSSYGTLSQKFKSSFDNSVLVSKVLNTYGLTNVTNIVEVVADIPPSTFIADPNIPDFYTANFSFDRSYQRLKGFSEGVLHALKIQIYFDCSECQYNGNSFSRTLFIVQSPNTNSYTVTFSVNNPTTGNIIICGESIPLASSDIVSAITIVSKIVTYCNSNPIPNYNVTSDSSNPGILYIVPISTSVAPPSIGSTPTGIDFSLAPTINWTVLQYPFIPNITDYDYMKNYVLRLDTAPLPIDPSDTTTPYIPFQVHFDYTSLNPADLNANLLGSGTIKIPNYLPNSYQNYINFKGASGSLLDSKIAIQVIAQPFIPDINSYYDNNIIKLTQTDRDIGTLINDITAQVTYA